MTDHKRNDCRVSSNNQALTTSFKVLPALNPGIFAAAMVMACPVCGLRPACSALALASKEVPKPTKATESPDFNVDSMALIKPSNARHASA